MSEHLCERCGKPGHDMAYVCPACGNRVAAELHRAALVAGEAAVTVAKLARIGAGGRRTDPEVPLPVNLGAGWEHDAAVGTLTTWARHIQAESGRPLPTVRVPGLACLHASCGAVRRRETAGPACARRPSAEHPTAILAGWLGHRAQIDWLRHRPEALEALDELEDAAVVMVRVVDRAPDRIVVGQCMCGAYLYAIRGSSTVTCSECEARYDVEAARQLLRQHLDQMLLTAAEIALLSVYLGLARERLATRKLINQWSARGVVVPHSVLDGQPAYRFGEIASRLMTSERVSA